MSDFAFFHPHRTRRGLLDLLRAVGRFAASLRPRARVADVATLNDHLLRDLGMTRGEFGFRTFGRVPYYRGSRDA